MEQKKFESEILNSFANLGDYLQYFFDDDISLAATDREKFIFQKNNSNLPMNATVGDKIPEGAAISEALKTGKIIKKDVPKEIYGVPFTSYVIPVKGERDEVLGSIVLAKSIVKKSEVQSQIQSVSSALEQISTSINNLSKGIQEVVDMNNNILKKTLEADNGAKNTDNVLSFIKQIANKTNMLGLNAAIEASRAGELGKGFGVVASEIRKLSGSTNESIKEVSSVLETVKLSISEINAMIIKSSEVFTTEAATIQEVAASIEEVNSATNCLEELSKKI